LCDDEDYLCRAELHRNIGEFEECRLMLRKIEHLADYKSIIAIRKAADEEKTLSFEII